MADDGHRHIAFLVNRLIGEAVSALPEGARSGTAVVITTPDVSLAIKVDPWK
jgi:hypothetical protein